MRPVIALQKVVNQRVACSLTSHPPFQMLFRLVQETHTRLQSETFSPGEFFPARDFISLYSTNCFGFISVVLMSAVDLI